MIRSTRPRTRAGISSSIAELIAEYSPPIPAPVKNRHRKKYQGVQANGGRDCRGEVDGERDREEPLPAEAVGELAEDEGADAGAGHVDRGSRADRARAE